MLGGPKPRLARVELRPQPYAGTGGRSSLRTNLNDRPRFIGALKLDCP